MICDLSLVLQIGARSIMQHLLQSNVFVDMFQLNCAIRCCCDDGDRRHHRPNLLSATAFKADNSLPWTSAMMLNFIRNSPAAFQPYIDVAVAEGTCVGFDPRQWRCWLLHCHYIALLLLNTYTPEMVFLANDAMLEHHRLFAELHFDLIIPKFHYGLHLPRDIFLTGPLKHTWCMRLEAKHQDLKSFLNRVNFIDTLRSLTIMHQRALAVKLYMCHHPAAVLGPHITAPDHAAQASHLLAEPSTQLGAYLIEAGIEPSALCEVVDHDAWLMNKRELAKGTNVLYGAERCIGKVVRLVQITSPQELWLVLVTPYVSGVQVASSAHCSLPKLTVFTSSLDDTHTDIVPLASVTIVKLMPELVKHETTGKFTLSKHSRICF